MNFSEILPVLGNIEMIWASNSKRFRVYGIFKKWQIDDDKFPELVKNDENDENDKFPELFIDGITLEKETVTKFLGVIIDENVTWKAHINTISTKISKSIGILYRARLIIPRKQLNQLYFSFVHSYLN